MPRPEPTEIKITEHGDETHESWLLIRGNNVTSSPGAKLFDSEIRHQHYIEVTVTRCTRSRDLNRDWLYGQQTLIEFDMSQAQWGAFVSSFGHGTGVPATLSFFNGDRVPGVSTDDSRLNESHKEVNEATAKGLAQIKSAHAAVKEAFDRKAGVKEMRTLLGALQLRIDQLPGNLEFAAKSLTEHTENVTTKARADIEGMVASAAERHGLTGHQVGEITLD